MSTTKLFEKHFGDTAAVDMKHPNMENFLEEINAECLEEDKHKKCNIPLVSNSVCDNYESGFYAEYGIDLCINCGQRKAKH